MSILDNPKHERFAQEIVRGVSATQAYRNAGYSVRSDRVAGAAASRLLGNVAVVNRIAEIQGKRDDVVARATEKAAEALSIDKQWVMGAMVENALIALGRKRVTLIKADKKTGAPFEVEVVMRDAAAANRSLELLGREFKMWIERKEIGEAGEFERMDERNLRDFIASEAASLGIGDIGAEEEGNAGIACRAGRLN